MKDDVQENLKNGAFRIVGEKGVKTDETGLSNAITKKAAQDPHYLAGIVKTTGIENPQQALSTFIKESVADAKRSNYMAKDIGSMQNKPDTYYAHLMARLAAGDGGTAVGVPQDLTIPYKEGTASVKTKGYVPVNSAALNLAGSPSYNMTTGEIDPQTLSSGDHQLVGAANIPFIKVDMREKLKDGRLGKQLKGAIANGDFAKAHPNDVEYRPMLHVQTKDAEGSVEDKFVPYDRLPKNVPKATLKALGGFKPYTQSVPKQVAQSQAKMPFSNSTHVTVQLPDGTTGQISRSKLKDFQLKYPKAKILQ